MGLRISISEMGATREELRKLCDSLVGDQLAKVELLTSASPEFLDELVDFGVLSSLQDVKLDILFTVLHLDEYIRDELGELYIDMVAKIYDERTLASDLVANDPLINYKYVRLINLCVNFCPPCVYPYMASLQEGFVHLISRSLGGRQDDEEMYLKDLATITELSNFFLIEKDSLDPELLCHLEGLLKQIVDKYSYELHFSYAIRIKIAKTSSAAARYDPLSNKGIEMNNTVPNAVNIQNSMDRRLISLGLALYSTPTEAEHYSYNNMLSLWQDSHFCTFVTSMLKSGDINLRCSALAFLTHPYFVDHNTWDQKQRVKQILPYLVDCLNYQPLPWWFDPFDTLDSLIELYHMHEPLDNPVIIFLSKTNIMYGLLTLFADCLSLKQQSRSSLRSTTKFIKLCASFAAYDELYRSLLLEQKSLLHHLEFGMETHLKLLKDFLSHKQVIMDSCDKAEMLPPLYDSQLVVAWLLLLKSFSRSVSALRTSLKRNKLAELLLELLQTTYQVTQECGFAGKEFLSAEIDVMGITLGCICNFVVEFSNLQSFMLSNGIVDITGEILKPTIGTCLSAIHEFKANAVKTNALWVLRHLMYNCQNAEKLDLLSKIPMSTILEYINDPSWPVQEQCFQLIRNLTCNSRKVVNILLEKFKDIKFENDPKTSARIGRGTTYLFQFLARKIKLIDPTDIIQRKTLEGVLYIIVNLAAVNENKKELVIEQDEILSLLGDILSETRQKVERYGNDSKLKLASLWVLNNLLWNSTISNYTQYALEGYAPSQKDEAGSNQSPMSPFAGEGDINESMINDEEEDDEDEENNNDPDDDDDDEGNEFVHGSSSTTDLSRAANSAAIKRCKKLVDMGIYDLEKQNVFDESLSVREKARTLQYHMDMLLKENL